MVHFSPPLPYQMQPEALPLVVQHNALLNARFSFSTLATRLSPALLPRISHGDTTFALCRIPIKELAPDSHSNTLYAEVDKMAKKVGGLGSPH